MPATPIARPAPETVAAPPPRVSVPPTLTRFAELQEKYQALLDIPPMPEDES